MLSPTFRGSDGDGHGKKQPSLDHGRLQAALFAAATASSGGVAGADALSNPPSRMPPAARTTSDDDEEDHEPASASGAAASTLKASSCRGRAPAVGAAESPTAPFLEHQGGRLGDNASSSEAMSSSTEVAAGGEEEEAAADSDLEGGDAGRGAGGGGPLLRLALRARREFVAVAATAAASPLPPLAPPKRARRQRRAPAVATLKEEGIAFATKGGAARGAAAASSSPPPPPPPPSSLLPALLPFCDILGAEALPRNASSSNPFLFLRNCAASASPHREPWLVRVHTVSKGSKLGDWRPRAVSLLAPSSRAARAWARSISRSAASSHAGRPRALLVLLNPFGGSRGAAARVWARVARPLLEGAAGIRCEVVETDSAGHAERAVRGLSLERLRALDGVVVVGGDGLFQEALNGLLAIRFGGNGGGGASLRALEASRLRLGHVPAGSTDALAWSIHGTRCPAAACLHVALGDGARLDVLALGPVPRGLLLAPPPASASAPEEGSGGGGGGLSRDDAAGRSPLTPSGAATSSGGGGEGDGTCSSSPAAVPRVPPPPLPPAAEEDWPPRAAACMASCGYFGDLLALSERIRWLGPARYGVAGLFALARLRRYELRIRYLPAEEEEGEEGEADCEGGGVGGSGSAPATPRTPAAGPLLPGAVGLAFARRAAAAAAPLSPPPSCPCPSEAGWRTDEGAFSAVLLACLPCRSDRSAGGVAPDRAMADGLASLVRVRRCSRLQFLRFLVAVSRDGARVVEGAAVAASEAAAAAAAATAGAAPEGGEEQGKKEKRRRKKKSERGGGGAAALPWVSVVAVRAVTVEPLPSKSSSASCSSPRLPWNADGETLPPSGVAAVVRKGLVRVFARPQLADE